jgi:hypothetical protein
MRDCADRVQHNRKRWLRLGVTRISYQTRRSGDFVVHVHEQRVCCGDVLCCPGRLIMRQWLVFAIVVPVIPLSFVHHSFPYGERERGTRVRLVVFLGDLLHVSTKENSGLARTLCLLGHNGGCVTYLRTRETRVVGAYGLVYSTAIAVVEVFT